MTHQSYPLIAFDQPGATFYACVIPAAKIVRRLEIRRRSKDEAQGVQRDEDLKRVNAVAKYLRTSEAILPTPIVVSAAKEGVKVNGQMLEIDDDVHPVGHVLDGQHRILGLLQLNEQELEQFALLVVFVFDIDAYADASVFVTINSNQRQVSRSLIYDLFGLNPSRSLEKVCHEIVRSLNDDQDSPFYRRVKVLGKKVEQTETLSQAAFIDHILAATKERDSPLRRFYDDEEEWAIRKIVNNLFRGISAALGQVPHQYPEDFFLKTTGYGGTIKALNAMITKGQTGGSLEEGYFAEIFRAYLQQFPEPPEGTGNAAMLIIKRRLREVLGLPPE